MADIAVSVAAILIENVITFLQQEANKHDGVHEAAESLRMKLERMQAFLSETEGLECGEVLRTQIKQVRDVAYDIEDVLERFMLQIPHHVHDHRVSRFFHNVSHFFADGKAARDFSTRIEQLNKKITDINLLAPDSVHNGRYREEGGPGTRGDHMTRQIVREDEIIGYKVPRERILGQLMEEDSGRVTLSLVGPGGSGKTILIRDIYKSRSVQGRFGSHAWIHVPRRFVLNELLLNVLKQFYEERNKPIPQELVDIQKHLSKYLEKERYLIILDNIWSRQDCDCVLNALPNGLPGSKVLVITQGAHVATSFAKSLQYIHQLNGLPWKEAWELFCKKAFVTGRKECPQELEIWAQKIVKKCEGMPFAIAAAGSLLSKKPQIPVEWKKFHDSLGSQIGADSSLWTISHIIKSSYMDLPIHLKICFLYFSIFPEDYSVRRGRLIRSWIAEGFVKERRRTTLEDVAEGYLNELVERNLVHVSSREIDGRVKSCRVLNLVREFIITRSELENFVNVLSGSSSTSGGKIRRLSVRDVHSNFSQGRDFSRIRALFLFGKNIPYSDLEHIFQHFRLLRVLDLQDIPMENFPKDICSLSLLRCLSLRQTRIKTVPDAIKNLAFLETLDLKHTSVTSLPKTVSKLRYLRHLLVYHYNVNNYVVYDSAQAVNIFEGIEELSNLQKLSLINVSKDRKIIRYLGKLSGLKKLGLTHLQREDGKYLCASIELMENLSTLDLRAKKGEYLDLDHMNDPPVYLQRLFLKGLLNQLPKWITSLDSLIKIGLKWSKLSASRNPLQTLERLPNLMELEMTDFYTGTELVFRTQTFKKLKILHMEQFDQLHTMTVQDGAMPMLNKLTMCKCRSLRQLPSGIQGLTQLEEVLLYDMPNEFTEKLRRGNRDRYMVDHVRVIHVFSLDAQSLTFRKENLS